MRLALRTSHEGYYRNIIQLRRGVSMRITGIARTEGESRRETELPLCTVGCTRYPVAPLPLTLAAIGESHRSREQELDPKISFAADYGRYKNKYEASSPLFSLYHCLQGGRLWRMHTSNLFHVIQRLLAVQSRLNLFIGTLNCHTISRRDDWLCPRHVFTLDSLRRDRCP